MTRKKILYSKVISLDEQILANRAELNKLKKN